MLPYTTANFLGIRISHRETNPPTSRINEMGLGLNSLDLDYCYYSIVKKLIIEGSLEVKLPTIWTVEKQR
jgi:hypothetical protein